MAKKNSTTNPQNVNQTTTCQICGRPIQANTGKIAHHGYRRPGNGWQTSSCLGARYLPYEVSRERIPDVIKLVKSHIATVTKALETHNVNPPDTLIYKKYQGAYKPAKLITVERPTDFNPITSYHSSIADSYSHLYFSLQRSLELNIKESNITLVALTERFENWKAPEPKPVLSDTEWCAKLPEMAVQS